MPSISLKALSDKKLEEFELKEKNGELNSSEKQALREHRFLPAAVNAMVEGMHEREARKELIRQSKFKVIDRIGEIDRLNWGLSFEESIIQLKSDIKKYHDFYWVVEDIEDVIHMWEGSAFVLGTSQNFGAHRFGPSYAIQLFQALVKNKNSKRVAQVYKGTIMFLYEGERKQGERL